MKKLLFLTAALLLSSLAYSQEAESTGSYAELTVVPYLELVPNYDFSEKKAGISFGNTSIYTAFEGAFSEHVSWTIVNHWFSLADTEDIWWPYKYIGYSSTLNWLDYLKLDFSFNNWTFSLGKDCVAVGAFDFDEWDWDIVSTMASPMWNLLSCYQWGGRVAYTTNSENTSFGLQMVTSPFGEHPFSSGLWMYTGDWRGEYGWFDCHWSVSALQYDKSSFTGLVALAQRATLGNWQLIFEYDNYCGNLRMESFKDSFKYGSYIPSVKYGISDSLELGAKALFSNEDKQFGATANWYPIKDSDALRLHAALAYSSALENLSFNVGIRYNLGIHLWSK
ncbi:MAG: hypothetical protein MJY89_03790 [Bacteroidales bacterium]|nr:hypothetical protein [Bacteroidales bacterium]